MTECDLHEREGEGANLGVNLKRSGKHRTARVDAETSVQQDCCLCQPDACADLL